MKYDSQYLVGLDKQFDNNQETLQIPRSSSQTYDQKAELNFSLIQKTTANTISFEKLEKISAIQLASELTRGEQTQIKKVSIDYHTQKVEFSKYYCIKKTLKSTALYQIHECQNVQNKQTYVAKIFFDKNNNDAVEELQIIQALFNNPHINIMKPIETFENGGKRIIIYEHFSGGTLLNYVINNLKLKENQVKTIMKQILDSLVHLHSLQIMHRDIKLDNIMLSESNNIKTIKLIDFGLSSFVSRTHINSNMKCGTPGYIAPEIFYAKSYNELCDVYSLGAVLHILTTGKRIYSTKHSQLEIYRKNERNQYRISSDLKCPLIIDLLQSMLSDEKSRPSAKQCLLHPLFTKLSEKSIFSNQISNKMHELNFPSFKNPFVQC